MTTNLSAAQKSHDTDFVYLFTSYLHATSYLRSCFSTPSSSFSLPCEDIISYFNEKMQVLRIELPHTPTISPRHQPMFVPIRIHSICMPGKGYFLHKWNLIVGTDSSRTLLETFYFSPVHNIFCLSARFSPFTYRYDALCSLVPLDITLSHSPCFAF